MPPGGMRAEIHGLIRIDQQHVNERAVVAIAAHGPRIRRGRIGLLLLRVKNREAVERGVLVQRDEWCAVRAACARHRQQATAVILRARGRRAKDAFQRDVLRHIERAFDQIISARHEDQIATRVAGFLHGGGEGSGVICLAIADGAEVADVQARDGAEFG